MFNFDLIFSHIKHTHAHTNLKHKTFFAIFCSLLVFACFVLQQFNHYDQYPYVHRCCTFFF